MPTWTLWISVGVPVIALIGGFAIRGVRNSNSVLHGRIDDVSENHLKMLGNCRTEFASKEEFVDFREETRKSFVILNKKVDDIPLKVKELLKTK